MYALRFEYLMRIALLKQFDIKLKDKNISKIRYGHWLMLEKKMFEYYVYSAH
jgi:hypothetical protein